MGKIDHRSAEIIINKCRSYLQQASEAGEDISDVIEQVSSDTYFKNFLEEIAPAVGLKKTEFKLGILDQGTYNVIPWIMGHLLNKDIVYFLHMPKTGGTSFNNLIQTCNNTLNSQFLPPRLAHHAWENALAPLRFIDRIARTEHTRICISGHFYHCNYQRTIHRLNSNRGVCIARSPYDIVSSCIRHFLRDLYFSTNGHDVASIPRGFVESNVESVLISESFKDWMTETLARHLASNAAAHMPNLGECTSYFDSLMQTGNFVIADSPSIALLSQIGVTTDVREVPRLNQSLITHEQLIDVIGANSFRSLVEEMNPISLAFWEHIRSYL